jgi:hypothetical protein
MWVEAIEADVLERLDACVAETPRRAVEDLQQACRARLFERDVARDGRMVAEKLARLLVTYAQHPAEAEDVLAAIDAVLGAGGWLPPPVVRLGPSMLLRSPDGPQRSAVPPSTASM